ncbi:MAG: hypothetical protein H6568_05610 [Lewinellaceae bacterium]|nr:hypothetical protein [Saprospiraceae bacterium]MCB9312224.1 hypothetical protein [Lewinellaceae bacterium]HRW77010.1 hypothetical protein [Saprospiraceae bacterium]
MVPRRDLVAANTDVHDHPDIIPDLTAGLMPQEIAGSMEGGHASVETNRTGLFRRLFAFMGPARRIV